MNKRRPSDIDDRMESIVLIALFLFAVFLVVLLAIGTAIADIPDIPRL